MLFSKEKSKLENTENVATIQDIALKLVEEQIYLLDSNNCSKESTIFFLGSKGVGKTTVINKFFERENEQTRSTLALEYSYGRRTSHTQNGSGKQVLNIWELGSLENSQQLAEIPLHIHGVENFSAIVMLDLSQPQCIWLDWENAYTSLRNSSNKILNDSNGSVSFNKRFKDRKRKSSPDFDALDLMPFPVVIVGGKYDIFKDFDPEKKKHICRFLRQCAHFIGASLLFYSNNIPKLSKTLRDTISNLGFGSPINPFRSHQTDYNDSLMIWFDSDSWEQIGCTSRTIKEIGVNFVNEIPQIKVLSKERSLSINPATDPGFRESIIDEMRAQKHDELKLLMKESILRNQFEIIE